MKEKLKLKIIKRFNDEKFKKIILFKNPNEFTTLYIEKVNPNHVGILWGKRHKKYNKGTHYIKCGKVFLSFIPVIFGSSVIAWLDAFTGYAYNLLLNAGIMTVFTCSVASLLFYYLPLKLSIKTGVTKC